MNSGGHGRVSSRNHYEALCVRENATYAEIRAQYRSALIALHPDKIIPKTSDIPSPNTKLIHGLHNPVDEADTGNSGFIEAGLNNYDVLSCGDIYSADFQSNRETGDEDEAHLDRFWRVQKAWEVLKDSKSREAYDFELQALKHNVEVIANEIELEEMGIEENGEGRVVEYLYPCRCGDYFVIAETELVEMGFRPSQWTEDNNISNLYKNDISVEGTKPEAAIWKMDYRAPSSREQMSRTSAGRSVILQCESCSLKIKLLF